MSDKPVTLDFIARQLQKVLDDMASFRDDMTVITAIVTRVEASVAALTTEMRATHSRHTRLERRVRALEDGEAS